MASCDTAAKVQIDQTIAGESLDDWRSYCSQRNFTYVVDQQNGNYSNMVSWDLSSAISQNSWMSLQESYVVMPFATQFLTSNSAIPTGCSGISGTAAILTTPTGTVTLTADNIALKSDYLNFIDSIQLFVNGEQLIDQTSMSNFPLQVISQLTMSRDNLKLKGSINNIAPDTATSIRYSGPNVTTTGDGYTNNYYLNAANTATLTGYNYRDFNNGLADRQLFINSPAATGAALNGYPPCLGSTVNAFTNIWEPYFSQAQYTASSTNYASCCALNYVVYLPLTRIADLLSKYPLVKGSQIRLQINFNAGTAQFTTNTTGTNYGMKMYGYSPLGGNTCPVMVTAPLLNPVTSTGTAGQIAVYTAIQTKTQSQITTQASGNQCQLGYSTLPNCRIYIANYVINPNYEERLLSNRVQRIRYMDWYQQSILNQANGASVSQTLSTAITNPQILIVLPFQTTGSSLFTSATGLSQFQSLFDSAPNTTLAGGMLAFQNANVSISGKNLFNQNANYTFDIWSQEIQRFGLNGGLNKELSSGLIDYTTFTWSPYFVADLSRRTEAQDKTYQSVTFQCTNSSGVGVDYYCFIGFQKEIEVDILTGQTKRIF